MKMNKRNRFVLGMLMACSYAFAQEKYQVSGHLEGMTNDTLIVIVNTENIAGIERKDTIVLDNGKFGFNVCTEGTRLFIAVPKQETGKTLSADGKPLMGGLAVAGEYMVINGSKVTGSPFYQELDTADKQIRIDEKVLKDLQDSVEKRIAAGENPDSVQASFRKKVADMTSKAVLDYIKTHPDSNVSAYMLLTLGTKANEGIALLSDKVKQGVMAGFIQSVNEMCDALIKHKEESAMTAEGTEAPDFTLNDVNGKPITLSSLHGKYVVLDFWGSWCGFCINGFPAMKEAYAKYKDKMEFLSIACNDTEANWKAALDKHRLPWLNVRNETPDNVSKRYGISGYPTKIILSPEGKILKKIVGEVPEFYVYLDKLFKE